MVKICVYATVAKDDPSGDASNHGNRKRGRDFSDSDTEKEPKKPPRKRRKVESTSSSMSASNPYHPSKPNTQSRHPNANHMKVSSTNNSATEMSNSKNISYQDSAFTDNSYNITDNMTIHYFNSVRVDIEDKMNQNNDMDIIDTTVVTNYRKEKRGWTQYYVMDNIDKQKPYKCIVNESKCNKRYVSYSGVLSHLKRFHSNKNEKIKQNGKYKELDHLYYM